MATAKQRTAAETEAPAVDKSKRKRRAAEPVLGVVESSEPEPRKKKRKRNEPPAETLATAEPSRKKSKKNKTGLPDPAEDSALSEQASKALSYAFLQFRKPAKWKFSKGHQNWLIRNYWTIPDAYNELTVLYLAKVEGGVRTRLIEQCQTKLSESTEPRAQALLDALLASSTTLASSTNAD
ncbi:hypothetical protein C8F01DRAFT_1116652 [Mycena amicta]|nr:hypothetical protein C8F01DRAFT_1116652 [Mycena amicta]